MFGLGWCGPHFGRLGIRTPPTSKFLSGAPPDLVLGTRFRWKTFGVTVESVVREFVPFERLAWDAERGGLRAYHAWLIQPTSDGCHVLTEEMERGWFARLGKVLRPKQLEQKHQVWLEQLKAKASLGLPSLLLRFCLVINGLFFAAFGAEFGSGWDFAVALRANFE